MHSSNVVWPGSSLPRVGEAVYKYGSAGIRRPGGTGYEPMPNETRAKTSYNQIAGRSVERLAALSDGVFAVAMTLLVLDLRAPAAAAVHNEHDLWRALAALSPRLVMYVIK